MLHIFLDLKFKSLIRVIMSINRSFLMILQFANLSDSKFVDTPSELNIKCSKKDGNKVAEPLIYANIWADSIHATSCLDISHAVLIVSQFMYDLHQLHPTAIRRILRYLCGTQSKGLFFSSSS